MQHRRNCRADFGDEHHRVLHHVDRVELFEGFADRRNDNCRIEDGMLFGSHKLVIGS